MTYFNSAIHTIKYNNDENIDNNSYLIANSRIF